MSVYSKLLIFYGLAGILAGVLQIPWEVTAGFFLGNVVGAACALILVKEEKC